MIICIFYNFQIRQIPSSHKTFSLWKKPTVVLVKISKKKKNFWFEILLARASKQKKTYFATKKNIETLKDMIIGSAST